MLNGEATDTKYIVFGLIELRLKNMIYRSRGEHAIITPLLEVLLNASFHYTVASVKHI